MTLELTPEFSLTDALAMRERLTDPTLQSAHAGTALRERLDDLTKQHERVIAQRDLVASERLKATASLRAKEQRAEQAIDGLKAWLLELHERRSAAEAPYDVALDELEDKAMELFDGIRAERAKLKLITTLSDEAVSIANAQEGND